MFEASIASKAGCRQPRVFFLLQSGARDHQATYAATPHSHSTSLPCLSLLVQLLDVFLHDDASTKSCDVYVVLEDGGVDLKTFFEKNAEALTVEHIQHISRQICAALSYLHSCRVVHRDLKPANILIDQRKDSPTYLHVRIADFGLSRAVELPAGTTAENVMSVILHAAIRKSKSKSEENMSQSSVGGDDDADDDAPQPAQDDDVASIERAGAALLQRQMTPWVVSRPYRAPEVILCDGGYSQVRLLSCLV